jgi:hypothetical protein
MICDHTIQIDIRKVPKNRRPLPDVVIFEGTRFETTWTETNFGGMRQWFLCPDCGRRCAIIYRDGTGPKWGCRVCLNGHYTSEHMSLTDRRLHAAFKVRERLGQTKGGIVVRFPPKPKGMHWRTYEGIRLEALRDESEILLRAHADIFGISIDQARASFC